MAKVETSIELPSVPSDYPVNIETTGVIYFIRLFIIIPTYLFRTEIRGVQQSSCRWVI